MNPDLDASALIAEDEPLLAAHLRHALQQAWPSLRIVGLAANGAQALERTLALRPRVEGNGRRVLTFGESAGADVRIADLVVDSPTASAALTAAGIAPEAAKNPARAAGGVADSVTL